MQVGDLVICNYRRKPTVCILVGEAEGLWWKVLYPDGKTVTVHGIYIRTMR